VRIKYKSNVLDLDASHVGDIEYDSRTAFLTELQIHCLQAEGATQRESDRMFR
jgi:hypothetical protein